MDGVATSETKDDEGISAGQVEQYLPSISLECSRQFKALLATGNIYTIPAATCFAAATDVPLLQCYAIMVTVGDDSELGESKLGGKAGEAATCDAASSSDVVHLKC
jgi:hypothetical protein